MTTGQWLVSLITIIWNHVHKTWEAHNDNCHGIDAATRESAKYETAEQETMELYEHHDRVVLHDHDLFYASTNEHF